MKKAIILYGPSGVGKTTIARSLSKQYNFKHCDTDTFKLMFSSKRSQLRSQIASKVCFRYAFELIQHGFNIIIEALLPKDLTQLKEELHIEKYNIIEISLKASLKECISRDVTRKERKFGKEVITEVFEKYTQDKGVVIQVSNKSTNDVLQEIKQLL